MFSISLPGLVLAACWLPILLGWFHMDIISCLSNGTKLPNRLNNNRQQRESIYMRNSLLSLPFRDTHWSNQPIFAKVYSTGPYLFDSQAKYVQTRHVFMTAWRYDNTGYNPFQTCAISEDAKTFYKLPEGPQNPRDIFLQISEWLVLPNTFSSMGGINNKRQEKVRGQQFSKIL